MTHPDLAEPNRTRPPKTDERTLSMQIMHSEGQRNGARGHCMQCAAVDCGVRYTHASCPYLKESMTY